MSTGPDMTTHQLIGFVLSIIAPIAVTIWVVFAMKYFSAGYQSRQHAAGDARYRALAVRAAPTRAPAQSRSRACVAYPPCARSACVTALDALA